MKLITSIKPATAQIIHSKEEELGNKKPAEHKPVNQHLQAQHNFSRHSWSPDHGPQESGHGTTTVRAQGVPGEHSQLYGLV